MINIDRIVAASKTVELEDTTLEDGFTAYGVYKIAKETFEAVGVEFEMTSQRFYNYAKNGKINGVKGAKRFTEDEVEGFVAQLIAKATR
jgi:hypothetical protein